jgi:hypothetical protein
MMNAFNSATILDKVQTVTNLTSSQLTIGREPIFGYTSFFKRNSTLHWWLCAHVNCLDNQRSLTSFSVMDPLTGLRKFLPRSVGSSSLQRGLAHPLLAISEPARDSFGHVPTAQGRGKYPTRANGVCPRSGNRNAST